MPRTRWSGLGVIARSTRQAKDQLVNLPQESILAYSALLMAPAGTQILAAMTGLKTPMPFTFNLCASRMCPVRGRCSTSAGAPGGRLPGVHPDPRDGPNITCQS